MMLTILVRVDILLCDSHHRIQIIQFVLSSPLLRCYSRREVEQMGGFQKIKTCGQPHQYLHYQKHDWSEAFSNIHVLGEGHFLSSINKQNKASYSHQPQLDVLRYPSSLSFSVIIPLPIIASKYVAGCCRTSRHISRLSPSSRRSINRWSCIITEKAPTRLKAATTAFTFKTLLRHYAKRALTPRVRTTLFLEEDCV